MEERTIKLITSFLYDMLSGHFLPSFGGKPHFGGKTTPSTFSVISYGFTGENRQIITHKQCKD